MLRAFRVYARIDQRTAIIGGLDRNTRARVAPATVARVRAALDRSGADFATATDLADVLVRALRLPFRRAHHVTAGSSPWQRRRAQTCRV